MNSGDHCINGVILVKSQMTKCRFDNSFITLLEAAKVSVHYYIIGSSKGKCTLTWYDYNNNVIDWRHDFFSIVHSTCFSLSSYLVSYYIKPPFIKKGYSVQTLMKKLKAAKTKKHFLELFNIYLSFMFIFVWHFWLSSGRENIVAIFRSVRKCT